ncbi:ribosomal large subunit pseudouridine synthase A [Ferrimonas balearica DSM 9799]|uniref:Pseudouridine synthase n=1 Tax=Ferrimonas balearica (strain DSM 9799 / CCM 4581 / KCTC 23876 / PAT) TaxID=550540 RepID=E1SRB5_FERBD|nr:bifunctional tRNA pseudouridine(32) synthase/23S rRNA pseudouridine(746) synthase RluA [Ferrimonas balearica]ADN74880.1 ribosomal large subunit pseudouridine synthase A [Ferrimonas balearica DSM 9799]MBW3140680.1 bifunctional tRNA pseudouridine(32) synthase/23S rRNA pseudouridine(746) synthase RluA [Ferrimonas balearica]MBW3165343.1 bifunctional tRNA pseudouridine(32) synthase/23S rRNA pseudouridine(746) synthase RluA [Ferrimonas balearica]MBY5981447.1 bifunctional tRNA pseudouridine(32) syn
MTEFQYQPPMEPYLTVLYEDKDIVVVDKPSGLLSVPGRDPAHRDSVYSRVAERYGTVYDVHRLDMATSGVMVLALRKNAERELKRQFRDRETSKTYLARVWGHLAQPEGEIDLPLICDWPNRPKQKVCHDTGKPSLTRYRVLSTDDHSSLLELTPITGRSHQLRVHLLALGHPILGDGFYAEGEALAAADRLLLHAHTLEIKQPYSGQPLRFEAAAPFA